MTAERSSTIDIAKGAAILGVILIHSELFSSGILHAHGINRAVPIFFVLFGLTSTLWWEKTPPTGRVGAWYRSRFARLVPPYWLAVTLWWVAERVLSAHPLGADALVFALAGYAPWIQTSWFVTAIFQLVAVFPLLRLASEKLGANAMVLVGLAVMVVAQVYALYINLWVKDLLPYPDQTAGFYSFWIFIPPYLWLIFCGARLVGFARSTGITAGLAALSVCVITALAPAFAPGLARALGLDSSTEIRIVASLADPARTLLLLAAAAALARVDALRRVLAWLGRNSWEIYLGQMTVHSLAYPAWERLGGPVAHRLEYTLVLLIGGVGFATAVAEARRRLRPAT